MFVTPLKKTKYLHVIMMLMIIVQANARPQFKGSEINSSPPFTTPLLSSRFCNEKNLNRTDTCQTDPILLKYLLDHCEFDCQDGEKPICVNPNKVGSAYICSPVNLTCEPGIRRIGFKDENNPSILIIREETCPEGLFQMYPSDCFHACRNKHLDLNNLPEEYAIFSRGDHTSPAFVYCDYEKGYYNAENQTLLDYDQDSKFTFDFCQHISAFNPCDEKRIVLPNSTCVEECPQGTCRDDHDGFVCKEHCSSKTEGVKEATTPAAKRDIPFDSTTESPKLISTPEPTDMRTGNSTSKQNEVGTSSELLLLAIFVVLVIITLIGLGGIAIYFLRHKKLKVQRIQNKIKKTIDNSCTTHIHGGDMTIKMERQPMIDTQKQNDGSKEDPSSTREPNLEMDVYETKNLKEPVLERQPSEETDVNQLDQDHTFRKELYVDPNQSP